MRPPSFSAYVPDRRALPNAFGARTPTLDLFTHLRRGLRLRDDVRQALRLRLRLHVGPILRPLLRDSAQADKTLRSR